jgi:predicted RNA-binding protein YlqC (UPF0109 family)
MSTRAEIEVILREIINGLIFHPGDLEMWVVEYPGLINVRLRAHAEDTARIIGDHGVIFKSLCKIAQAIAWNDRMRVAFSSVETPIVGEPRPYPKFEAREDWPRKELKTLLLRTAKMAFEHESQIWLDDEAVSDEETVVMIHVAKAEQPSTIERVGESLAYLFNAIGRRNGRMLTVVVIPDVPAGDRPKRHVAETRQ